LTLADRGTQSLKSDLPSSLLAAVLLPWSNRQVAVSKFIHVANGPCYLPDDQNWFALENAPTVSFADAQPKQSSTWPARAAGSPQYCW